MKVIVIREKQLDTFVELMLGRLKDRVTGNEQVSLRQVVYEVHELVTKVKNEEL